MDPIKITLETLYDLLRNEKKRGELQELNPQFFIDVVSYVREKQALLKEKEASQNIFAGSDKEKLESELKSIQRIIKENYELREKKIIDTALNRSKTGSNIIDTSAMLREEKDFYEQILQVLDHFRKQVLYQLFQGQLPETKLVAAVSAAGNLKKAINDNPENQSSLQNNPGVENNFNYAQADKTKIKFIHPTPRFVWKDMKVYGPYDIGEQTEMFPEVAELLVRKKRAEKV